MKKLKDHISDDLLVKYLLNITSASENVAVVKWLSADAAHQRYFKQFQFIWEETGKLAAATSVNEAVAWNRFQQRIVTNEKPVHGFTNNSLLRIAAIMVLLLGAAGSWYMLSVSAPQMIVRSGQFIKIDTLPDGSTVTLNKQSTVRYSALKQKRSVQLTGEAFFNVKHNAEKPFVIKVNDVTVKVLGTAFNVKSSSGKTEVIVENGSVEVTKKHYSVQLKQHEKATVTEAQPAPVKQGNTDELYNYYRTQTFVCNNTPLWELVNILNEAFDVHIVIANASKRNVPINSTFTNRSLDSTLKVIALTCEVVVEKTGFQIVLK